MKTIKTKKELINSLIFNELKINTNTGNDEIRYFSEIANFMPEWIDRNYIQLSIKDVDPRTHRGSLFIKKGLNKDSEFIQNIQRIIDYYKSIILDFGEHRGMSLMDIYINNFEYYKWVASDSNLSYFGHSFCASQYWGIISLKERGLISY